MGEDKKVIIVTGASGFVASHILRRLVAEYPEHRIINIDRNMPRPFTRDLFDQKHCEFIQVDLCDARRVAALLKGLAIEYIIHAAAQPSVDVSIASPADTILNNTASTVTMLDIALKHFNKGYFKKFLYVSTDEVYGPAAEGQKFKESDPYESTSPYAASKAASEIHALSYLRTFGLPLAITRCTNNFGPNQISDDYIPTVIANLIDHKEIHAFKSNGSTRCWLYVEDHVDGILTVLARGEGIYNLSSNNPISAKDVLAAVRHEYEVQSGNDTEQTSPVVYIPDRPGLDYAYDVDTTKIEQDLNWHARFSFADRIKPTVVWYIENSV